MPNVPSFGTITAIIGALSAVGGCLKWLYNVAKKIDTTFTYVEQLRTNHMPHLEAKVNLILKHLGIEIPE